MDKPRFSPFLATILTMAAMGMNPGMRFGKPEENEIDKHLRLNNRTLEEEYKLIQEKKSSLTARQRGIVEYRFEQKYKNMENQNTFNILCPGPSLNTYEVSKRINLTNPGILIAVNGAILAPFKFDYWIFQDIEVFETIRQKTDISRFYDVCLLCPRKMYHEDLSAYPIAEALFRNFKVKTFPAESNEVVSEFAPFGKHINWREYTMFMAILCSIRKGAQQIKIYGADLGGTGYFTPGLGNERTRHLLERWANERRWLGEIVKLCAENGITLTRWTL